MSSTNYYIERTTIPGVVGNHEERIRALEFSPGGGGGTCGPLYTVGTVGIDGVDALILANPAPYNAPPYIPFSGTWTQALGTNAPVQFWVDNDCEVVISGAPAGGTINSEVFLIPAAFRPLFQKPFKCPIGDGTGTGEADIIVFTTGSVYYVQNET